MSSDQIGYRRDIDGLRAVAVLSVVFFHAFPGLLRGGFIGVDVFFVISGFLISSILFKNLNDGQFSLLEFYSKRIRRIFPGLLLVLVFTYALGWYVLLAREYQQLGQHVIAGAGFFSNFTLWNEAGYFDASADTKPLLHLWSLGIEEQFYILWPIILWLAWKAKLNIFAILLVGIFISFACNIFYARSDGVAAFYAPHARFWELLAGGALSLKLIRDNANGFFSNRFRQVLSVLGAFLIFCGFFVIHGGKDFPGFWGLIPVVGAIFIIGAGSEAWLNRVVLSHRALVFIGLISFPLYLWHWPLLTFSRLLAGGNPSWYVRVAVILVSFLLAWVTYRFVERPIRFGANGRARVAVLVLVAAGVACVGVFTSVYNGFEWRAVVQINEEIDNKLSTRNDGGGREHILQGCGLRDAALEAKFANCIMDDRASAKYALMGDSKASALYAGLFRTSSNLGRWMFIGGYHAQHGAPLPLLEAGPDGRQSLNSLVINAIANNENIEKVVLAVAIRNLYGISPYASGTKNTYDPTYLRRVQKKSKNNSVFLQLDRAIKVLSRAGKEVIFLIDNPALPNPQDCIGRRTSVDFLNDYLTSDNSACQVSLTDFNDQILGYRKMLEDLEKSNSGSLRIFDPTDIYCDNLAGFCGATRYGRLLYSETDHISDFAAGIVGAKLNAQLNGVR